MKRSEVFGSAAQLFKSVTTPSQARSALRKAADLVSLLPMSEWRDRGAEMRDAADTKSDEFVMSLCARFRSALPMMASMMERMGE